MNRSLKRPLTLFLLLTLLLLTGCTKISDGLSLSVCTGGKPESLDPIHATDPGEQTILNHLYENLMRVTADASGRTSVTNGMAKSVDM